MIRIGLAGWGDHDDLYTTPADKKEKLRVYSSHFPVVELDSSFYAVQPLRNTRKWVKETPPGFGFVVKAYQGMTGHLRGKNPFESTEQMFRAFAESIEPMREAGKLTAVLMQYPPWFDCTRENVDALREAKSLLDGLPLAVEFRHRSWYAPEVRERTLGFLEQEGWIHTVCDEPQVGSGSVPIVLRAANPDLTLVRFHGRNDGGWVGAPPGKSWRDVRYLYRYSRAELLEWKERLKALERSSREVAVIFNNNSGGDAAANAKEMMELLGIEDEQGLAPRQLDLF
ncbi:DUF72 domain-containing protein [Paenibacillus chitinolyticus]|uniref:DUF72 domain-containing protein n=1 Tax=Paenibacillus chitinolyticus TaxID=79263 RepID=UPI002DBF147F|nr:DUF72 domain-containing protein [Paenibacillus chitinolyticus]MEC0246048.1 DUF72 domain-containing protein [Paenibacillus chitinolyticus]